jgi:hypothetical protein
MSVKLVDVIVPERFTPYAQLLTTEKMRIVQSGAAVVDAELSALLAGGGSTFTLPKWKPIVNEEENISDDSDDEADAKKTSAAAEVGVRLSRNQLWGSKDLVTALAGSDPMASIAEQVSSYWALRAQAALIATMKGVFADNDAAPSTDAEHDQGDLTLDLSDAAAGSYSAGVTDFSASAFLDTVLLMGDSMEDLALVLVHSVIYNRMQKNNLIDFIPDAEGRVNIPTFLGRQVIVDDGMPFSDGVFESWVFGRGAVRIGTGSPAVPTEVDRNPKQGKGGGETFLHNRVEWMIHPTGHAYVGTPTSAGGPSNATTQHNLAHADSWERRYPERKMIKVARLITREMAPATS